MKIYHNPRCNKSRETLKIITDSGADVEIIEYLKIVPTEDELITLVEKLGIPVNALLRKNEAVFKEQFKGKILKDSEWITSMVKYPKLIERPIVVKGDKAIIGRPPKNVELLL